MALLRRVKWLMSLPSSLLFTKSEFGPMPLPSSVVALERIFTTTPLSSAVVFRTFLGCTAFMAMVAARLVRGTPRRR